MICTRFMSATGYALAAPNGNRALEQFLQRGLEHKNKGMRRIWEAEGFTPSPDRLEYETLTVKSATAEAAAAAMMDESRLRGIDNSHSYHDVEAEDYVGEAFVNINIYGTAGCTATSPMTVFTYGIGVCFTLSSATFPVAPTVTMASSQYVWMRGNQSMPSAPPTAAPTSTPTTRPTVSPTASPTTAPTSIPTKPTAGPTARPSTRPTAAPSGTAAPTSFAPTQAPTAKPSLIPTSMPTSARPSVRPTTASPTNPTTPPSPKPSSRPTAFPTNPTPQPTGSPDVLLQCFYSDASCGSASTVIACNVVEDFTVAMVGRCKQGVEITTSSTYSIPSVDGYSISYYPSTTTCKTATAPISSTWVTLVDDYTDDAVANLPSTVRGCADPAVLQYVYVSM
jgi:hypothetical protein